MRNSLKIMTLLLLALSLFGADDDVWAAEAEAEKSNSNETEKAAELSKTPADMVSVIYHLRSRNPVKRSRAVEVCRQRGPAAAAAIEALLELLTAQEQRVEVVQALGNMEGAALPAAARLAALLDDGDEEIRDAAVAALLRIGPQVLDFVKPYAEKEKPISARKAALYVIAVYGEQAAFLRPWLKELMKEESAEGVERAGTEKEDVNKNVVLLKSEKDMVARCARNAWCATFSPAERRALGTEEKNTP